MLKYVTSCHVRSTAYAVLDGFFPYLAQMINSMRGCVACNDPLTLTYIFKVICGWGLGAFLKWWPPSTMWAGSFNLFMATTGGCLNNPIFFNLGLCAVCWAHFMCYHELWPTSVGHPFSFLNSSWGLTGENITRKLLSLSLDLFFKILLFQVSFLTLFFYSCLFSLLSSGWFVIAVCGSISVQGTS